MHFCDDACGFRNLAPPQQFLVNRTMETLFQPFHQFPMSQRTSILFITSTVSCFVESSLFPVVMERHSPYHRHAVTAISLSQHYINRPSLCLRSHYNCLLPPSINENLKHRESPSLSTFTGSRSSSTIALLSATASVSPRKPATSTSFGPVPSLCPESP